MRLLIATMALTTALALATTAVAQRSASARKGASAVATPPARPFGRTPAGAEEAEAPKNATNDSQVVKSDGSIPEPKPLDEMGQPTIPLPTEPIEPFLLQKEHGPFMVLAHTFRGPDATRWAQALAMELQNKYHLPAYVWYVRIQPGRSNIRGVNPTAPRGARTEDITPPERFLIYDEAAVLVGNCKSTDESLELMKRVQKLRSTVLDGLPSIYHWRKKGLSRAMMTTNPLRAAQELYPNSAVALKQGGTIDPSVVSAAFANTPKKPDAFLKRINKGPHSLLKCPGDYVLQVAEFSGRTSLEETRDRAKFNSDDFLRKSPLAHAADDAEKLADGLAKSKKLGGLKPYVYHDRFSSKVFIGPFSSEYDPAVRRLCDHRDRGTSPVDRGNRLIDEVSFELIQAKVTILPLAPKELPLTPVPHE